MHRSDPIARPAPASRSGTGSGSTPPGRGPYDTIAVIGAGAWGTALAMVALRAGRRVRLWGRNAEDIAAIARTGCNPRYLPGIALPEGLIATTDIGQALDGADCVLLVTPSVTLREICRQIAPDIAAEAPVVLCAKGIETGSGKLLSEVAGEELPGHQIGALSGPTFARETALNYPPPSPWPSPSPRPTVATRPPRRPRGWRCRSVRGCSGPMSRTIWSASRSRARSRTWSPLPAA